MPTPPFDRAAPPLARAAIVAAARGWIGTPYRHQASLKGAGADCLGLVRGVWRELIGPEPETAPPYPRDWAEGQVAARTAEGQVAARTAEGQGVAETGEAQTPDPSATGLVEAARRHLVEIAPAEAAAGDVVLFRWRDRLPARHAGILTGPDAFVHAYDGSAVVESPLGPWWRRRIVHAFRFPGVTD